MSRLVALALTVIALSCLPGCGSQPPPEKAPGTVAGGTGNRADALHATVGGGTQNTAAVAYAVVSGGLRNVAGATRATIGGGYDNLAGELDATVGGGAGNTAGGIHATVAGGSQNRATGYDATVGGGSFNTATGTRATVAGGAQNRATDFDTTVAGGAGNTAAAAHATVGGGLGNAAGGIYATVAGGYGHTAAGAYATIPGGSQNRAAGDYSFAAGRRAAVDAAHPGAFLFADAVDFAFASAAANEFAVRATGGVRLVSAVDGQGRSLAGVTLAPGSGSWSLLSSRGAKADLAPIDGVQIVEALSNLPIATWRYTNQGEAVRHIGPMAEDFYAAFGLGEDDRQISAVDADGVALAAIQGLYQRLQAREAQVEAQQDRIEALEARVVSLEATLTADRQPPRSLFRDPPAGWLFAGNLLLFGALFLYRARGGAGRRSA